MAFRVPTPVMPLLLTAFLAAPAALAGEAPAPPAPDEAARAAMEAIQNDIAAGRVGWWGKTGNPAVKFLGTYSGLGTDVVTLATVNEMESIWPAWKGLNDGLEKFGIAFTIYTCASYAADGRNDLATLTALKDFLKFRLSKFSNLGAFYAAGAGIVDYSLNALADAAVSQVNDDFYSAYRAFQMRQRGLRAYTELILSGGYEAVNRALDSFWDDEATAGIRGYALLASQDPEYKAHFRMRFIREELLTFLTMWAEREADRARLQAEIQAERLAEEIRNTSVVLETQVVEAILGEGASDITAEALRGDKVIATAKVAGGKLELRFLLSEILVKRDLPRSIQVRLTREGDKLNSPQTFSFPLRSPRGQASRSASAGVLKFTRPAPVYVRTKYQVDVTVSGPEAGKVSSVSFAGLSGNRDSMTSGGRSGIGASAQIKGGHGTATVTAGKYLLEVYGQPPQPVTVDRAMTVTFETRTPVAADAAAAPSADLSSHASALSAVAGKIRAGGEPAAGCYADLAEACERYRLAVRTYEAECRRAMEGWYRKDQEISADAAMKSEEKSAARKECTARRNEVSEAMNAALKADIDRMNAAQKELQAAEKERRDKRTECGRALSDADRKLSDAVRALEDAGRDAAGAFEEISRPVENAYMDCQPMSQVEEEMAKVRAAMAKVDAQLPVALKLADELPALLDAYRKAVSDMEDANLYSGDETNVDYHVLARADEAAARAEALRKSDLGAKAAAFLARCEKRLERRQKRAEQTARLVREIDAAAAALPANAGADLTAALNGLRPQADRLFAAFAKPADDWAAWKKLAADIERAVADRKPLLGDLLDGAERADTAFSKFRDTFDAAYVTMSYGDLPQDWWKKLRDSAWSKSEARDTAAADLLALREDVRRLLALGKDRPGCAAELERRRAAIAALLEPDAKGKPAAGTAAKLTAVEEAGKALDGLPRPLASDLRAKWDALRRELVRSGEVEAYLRASGRPFAVFHTIDKQPLDRAFYWPEALPPGQADQWAQAVLRIDGLADDEMAGMATSFDGGRTWQPTRWNRYDQGFNIGLPRAPEKWFVRGFRLRVELPGNKPAAAFTYLPAVRYPGD